MFAGLFPSHPLSQIDVEGLQSKRECDDGSGYVFTGQRGGSLSPSSKIRTE